MGTCAHVEMFGHGGRPCVSGGVLCLYTKKWNAIRYARFMFVFRACVLYFGHVFLHFGRVFCDAYGVHTRTPVHIIRFKSTGDCGWFGPEKAYYEHILGSVRNSDRIYYIYRLVCYIRVDENSKYHLPCPPAQFQSKTTDPRHVLLDHEFCPTCVSHWILFLAAGRDRARSLTSTV